MFASTPEVDADQAQQLAEAGAVLVDVRRADEWDAGHAPGALHIPLDHLPARVDDLTGAGRLVMVCRSGSRSARATRWLRAQGCDAVNLAGGMQAWARSGGAVVCDDDAPGRVA